MPDDRDDAPIDPPDNQVGGNATATNADSASASTDEAPIDPPDNQGGGN